MPRFDAPPCPACARLGRLRRGASIVLALSQRQCSDDNDAQAKVRNETIGLHASWFDKHPQPSLHVFFHTAVAAKKRDEPCMRRVRAVERCRLMQRRAIARAWQHGARGEADTDRRNLLRAQSGSVLQLATATVQRLEPIQRMLEAETVREERQVEAIDGAGLRSRSRILLLDHTVAISRHCDGRTQFAGKVESHDANRLRAEVNTERDVSLLATSCCGSGCCSVEPTEKIDAVNPPSTELPERHSARPDHPDKRTKYVTSNLQPAAKQTATKICAVIQAKV